MQTTIYKLSHHGASNLANKPVSQNAHMPKAVFVSGNPWYSYRHPRCSITDGFITYVGSLCQPAAPPSSPDYCGPHPVAGTLPADRVQSLFTCGESTPDLRTVTNNPYAIYSTVPDANTLNVIKLSIDGTNWGFTNSFQPKIVR